MDYFVLGIDVGNQHSDDPYVLAWRLKSASEPPLTLPVMLAYRIWYVDWRATKLCDHRKSELRPILHVIIDAGLIYSVTLFAALICYVNTSNGQYVVLDMVSRRSSLTDENNLTETFF